MKLSRQSSTRSHTGAKSNGRPPLKLDKKSGMLLPNAGSQTVKGASTGKKR